MELLGNLPLVTGFGIRGDVLAIEDTFSLLTGQPVKLSGFIELGSLMLLAGWAMPTCNMPACHALMTGSVLNKQVSRADDRWGQEWSQIPDAMQMYAFTDLKQGWLTWVIAVGCMFPDPETILFLTCVNQKEFVAEFNAIIQEALVGTEIQTGNLSSAQTREAVARCIRYGKRDGTLALSPPSRVMTLIKLVSPWANITYGGCRYLREARLETLRKYSVLHKYFKEMNQPSIFERVLDSKDEEYVLMGLTREECTPVYGAA